MSTTGALSHVRVLDLSRILAGPWATQSLADLGADVIKVERPGSGDDTRGWGPPYLENDPSRSAYFCSVNRNKRSLALDLSDPKGAEILRRIARESHVVVENFKQGALSRYGLGYESLSAENPSLVYCSITGFGQDGPEASRPGYDFMIQGMAGLMSVTGEPSGMPMKVGVALSDVLTGLNAAVAILAALNHAERTGQGQFIDMSLFDVTVASLANQAANYLFTGAPPARLGN
ncbi:MAG: CaiB/BaiF CoA-transferase family protein, partial [Myxococcota bacterium]